MNKTISYLLPPFSPDIENKAEYGKEYYNEERLKNMKVGYVHPYHTSGSPIFFSNHYFLKNLFTASTPSLLLINFLRVET